MQRMSCDYCRSLAEHSQPDAGPLRPPIGAALGRRMGSWVGPGWGGALALGAWLGWRRASWGWGAPRYVVAPGFY